MSFPIFQDLGKMTKSILLNNPAVFCNSSHMVKSSFLLGTKIFHCFSWKKPFNIIITYSNYVNPFKPTICFEICWLSEPLGLFSHKIVLSVSLGGLFDYLSIRVTHSACMSLCSVSHNLSRLLLFFSWTGNQSCKRSSNLSERPMTTRQLKLTLARMGLEDEN